MTDKKPDRSKPPPFELREGQEVLIDGKRHVVRRHESGMLVLEPVTEN